MGEGGEEAGLEFTPTWVVAVVCTIIIAISLLVERCIHYGGQLLKRKNQKPLFEALQEVKEELMLLGFISLMLTVLQGAISKICIPERFVRHMLPCSLSEEEKSIGPSTVEHAGRLRRMLSEMAVSQTAYCANKHKVPFLSVEALHHLHIFIFVLAVVHVTFCVLTVLFGGARIRQWKRWEDDIAEENYDTDQALRPKVTHVHEHAFIRDHFVGIGESSGILGWTHSFFKQFYAAVTKADYLTLRLGFIMTHCRGNPKFNFHKYMIRALEDDFKHVVGIRLAYVLLDCIYSFHCKFFTSALVYASKFLLNAGLIAAYELFCQLLLAVGTKLEHVITELAHEVAEKHVAIEGELVVKPSDEHFWFNRPQIVLFLIHFILFQNAFEIAFFFWIWVQYGFDSCIMGKVRYIIPRLIIGVIIQVLCSYSTLPLYAIVTQMGSTFKKAIFDEHVQAGILGWREKVKRKKAMRGSTNGSTQPGSTTSPTEGSVSIQLGRLANRQNEGNEAQPTVT
ncbi:hypothetical protein Cgig2_012814 [Carnegiea gigantea]|uniref:MLO-like protein n=1 Tax=Carnegiea gigantea TaxID=171969 RepID=A0A9Q1KBN0_9CARY|nr:hypothetical protein Cgig2_012814 [Carnegiea gigantea]